MSFGDVLNTYMEKINCNSKNICELSGISPTVISRYLNNKRTPRIDSENLEKIIDSLFQLSIKNKKNLSKESIREALLKSINPNNVSYDDFIDNFNTLQTKLNISTADIAKAIDYDASFLSRIKNRQRKPSNIENFLFKLDNFNLNDYIGTDFSKVKVPTTPIIIKNSKVFYGVEGRKQAEGEFLKTTLLSKSKEPIFFYNDFPISKAGEDEEFKKKWILAMTMLLKKGLHLNIVHNVNRPIDEMLLGLEGWIPIYMTGSISPYYYKEPPSNFFLSAHCTSGSVALSSECIEFDEQKSRFYLTTKKDELEFAKKKSSYMLSKANPLMEIYKEADREKFEEFMNADENKNFQVIKKDIFKNIDFFINENRWVMINKNNLPEINFVIYNDNLINSIKNFLLE